MSFEDGESRVPPYPLRLLAVDRAFARYSYLAEIDTGGGERKKKQQPTTKETEQ